MNDNTVVLGVCPSVAESIIRREKELHTRNVLQFFLKISIKFLYRVFLLLIVITITLFFHNIFRT